MKSARRGFYLDVQTVSPEKQQKARIITTVVLRLRQKQGL